MRKPPPLYLPLPTPDEMSRWDQGAHSLYSIPPALLMENAAQAAFSELRRLYPLKPDSAFLIFTGRGNNGGDGAALGRILHDEGYRVLICASAPPETLPNPAREHAAMAAAMGVTFHFPAEGTASGSGPEMPEFTPDIVVDALTGTGIKGNLRPRELALVRLINSYRGRAFIFSLDIPSGLSGLTGKAMPEAVRAHATVCFEAGKPGLYMPEAGQYTGKLAVRRVGIPKELRRRFPPSWRLLAPAQGDWAAISPLSHKGDAGKVLIVGGSEGMAGAPLLAALGSLRAGGGLVHAVVPAGLEPAIRAGWPEVLTHPLGDGRHWQAENASGVLELLRRIRPDAFVMGPGMGRTPAVETLLRAVLEAPDRPPLILDADALYFFRLPEHVPAAAPPASDAGLSLHALLTDKDILTPHPGEMARMLPQSFFTALSSDAGAVTDLGRRIALVQEHRQEALLCFTQASPAVLILKGAGTLIGQQGKPGVLSPFAVGALGVGGSGDVLAGVCASLAAMGFDSLDAASLAVYLHGRAGELLAERTGRGHLAREIAESVPLAWEELCRS